MAWEIPLPMMRLAMSVLLSMPPDNPSSFRITAQLPAFTSAAFPDGSSYTYTYDSQGRLQDSRGRAGVITIDDLTSCGRISGILATACPAENGTSSTFTYDAGGRRSSTVDQSGFTVTYASAAVTCRPR